MIFITNQESTTHEELLQKLGYEDKERWRDSDFYGTNKQHDLIFAGTKGKCTIISNGRLTEQAFQEDNPFLKLKESEIAAIIWNETVSLYGFCLIKNGVIIRHIMSYDDASITNEYGKPIQEEIEINESELLDPEEIQEIIESVGKASLKNIIMAEKVCVAANNLAKRYIGTRLVEVRDHIEMIEYR